MSTAAASASSPSSIAARIVSASRSCGARLASRNPLTRSLRMRLDSLLRVFSLAALRSQSTSSTTAVSWSDGSSLKISLAERCLFSSLAVAPTACFPLSGGSCPSAAPGLPQIPDGGCHYRISAGAPACSGRARRVGVSARAAAAHQEHSPGPTRRRWSSPNPARWSSDAAG